MSRDVLLSLEILCLNTPLAFCEQNDPTIFPTKCMGDFSCFTIEPFIGPPFRPTYHDRLGAHLVPINPRKSLTFLKV